MLQHNFRNLVANDRKKGLHMLGDDRIHITSSEKITITCYINDNQSFVEMFLVHPVGMGGDYYAFSLPGRSTMTLYFLPLGTTNETMSQNHDVHNVSITLKQTNNKLETIKQDMKAGSLWQYTAPVERTVSIWIRDQLNNHSAKEIESTERAMSDIGIPRMMVIASIRDISIGGVKKTDFSCFMPTPLIVDRCAKLTNPVYHPVIKAFANDFLFTAPSHQCPQDKFVVFFCTFVDKKFLNKINVLRTAMMNIVNFGGGKGTFIYEIPEYSQWITDHVIPVRIPKNYNATLRVRFSLLKQINAIGAQGEEAPHNITLHHAAIASDTIWIFHVEGNFDRYLPIVIAETDQTSVGYIPAINRLFDNYSLLY
uniref:DUF4433 domain-containing protein n=1 Tax=Elaeophora elaphi TaxID=1147741 RepID=A0A0R3RY44_9BILA